MNRLISRSLQTMTSTVLSPPLALRPSMSVVAPLSATSLLRMPAMVDPLGHLVEIEAVKREYNPSVVKRRRKHGYLKRIGTKGGKRVISRRRDKGRHILTV